VKEYDGKVRVVYMNMVVHPQVVQDAHLLGCAAAKQKRFLEYKHMFWDKAWGAYAASGGKDKSSMSEEGLLKMAGEAGFDAQKLKADAHSPECQQRLEGDMAELAKFRVNGTPAFFINGQHVGGGIPKDAFKTIIEEKLKIAEKSGVSGAEYYEKEIRGKGVPQFRSKKEGQKAGGAGP
jgi:protein-disulfide isomerase